LKRVVASALLFAIFLLSACVDTPGVARYDWSNLDNGNYVVYEENGRYYLELRGEALEKLKTNSQILNSQTATTYYRGMSFSSVQEMMDCINDNRFSNSQFLSVISNCMWYLQEYKRENGEETLSEEEYAKAARMPLFDPNSAKDCTYPDDIGPCTVCWDNLESEGLGYYFCFDDRGKEVLCRIPRNDFQPFLESQLREPAKQLWEEGKLVYDERADAYVHYPVKQQPNLQTKQVRYYQLQKGSVKIYVRESCMVSSISGMGIEYGQYYHVLAYYDTPEGCFKIDVNTDTVPTQEWLCRFSLKSITQ